MIVSPSRTKVSTPQKLFPCGSRNPEYHVRKVGGGGSQRGGCDFTYEIYHPALNTTGDDYPDGVGTLIAVSIDEDAGAARGLVDPAIAKAIIEKYSNRRS